MRFVMTVCAYTTYAQLMHTNIIITHAFISIYITYTAEDTLIIYKPFVNKTEKQYYMNIKYIQCMHMRSTSQ